MFWIHLNVVLCSFQPAVNWVVPVADRERYKDIFKQTDGDGDGLVTGTEVIEIFMQSSLSQTMLAQIWWDHISVQILNLEGPLECVSGNGQTCSDIIIISQSVGYMSFLSQVYSSVCRGLADTKQTGKLNHEQFSLAMYLIQQKVTKGVDPPSSLTPDMIPPSERTGTAATVPVSPDFRSLLLRLYVSLFIQILSIFQANIVNVLWCCT